MNYEVIVSNLGCVFRGSQQQATAAFYSYARKSQSEKGSSLYGRDVSMHREDGSVMFEYHGTRGTRELTGVSE